MWKHTQLSSEFFRLDSQHVCGSRNCCVYIWWCLITTFFLENRRLLRTIMHFPFDNQICAGVGKSGHHDVAKMPRNSGGWHGTTCLEVRYIKSMLTHRYDNLTVLTRKMRYTKVYYVGLILKSDRKKENE